MRSALAIFFVLGFIITGHVYAQDSVAVSNPSYNKYTEQVASRATDVGQKLDRQSEKAIKRLQKQEARINKKLQKIDSSKAKQLFANTEVSYAQLEKRLQNTTDIQQYIPSLDTMGTSLNFLAQNPQLSATTKQAQEKLAKAVSKVKDLKNSFQKAEEVKKFLKERREYLKQQLSQTGFSKELKKLNKQVYYYSSQLNEYKEILKDHKKAERKALELLSKTRLYRDFMRKNSMLASLFRLPGEPDDPVDPASLAGLQTRTQVNTLIQQQLAAGGPDAQQQFRQNMQEAQSQLNQLKNKVTQSGGGSSENEMPEGFKPNDQKTKTFLQHLELGTNIQSQKSNGYFPTTSDIGLSIGYKLNDKSIIGIGTSYKLGWGQNIRNIRVTHQGVGLRSFVDWKIKGSFWMSGGYEMNYRSEFDRIQELRSLSGWQQSGLIGLSKIASLKSKVLKKTKLQLLWDFMSYQQVPRTQTILFRIGYSLN
jgi:hypothetical protein